jgi:2-keto-4-pentenoate hydratase/2-oxohepta-3-ene-1,7-dioic acid hydratase in catechol pathway
VKLASWRSGEITDFGLVADDGALASLAHRFADLRAVVASGEPETLADLAQPTGLRVDGVTLLPPILNPGKILCVGVNYPERNAEYKDGSELPKYPSLFVRFPGSFVGHGTPVLRPPESEHFDYEGEIVIVIGKAGRRIPEAEAHCHIFGFTLMNEGTIRDWVRHGKFNVTQGKNFDHSGAIGPWVVPISAATPPEGMTVITRVNGEERQRGHTGTLAFSFARIIAYVSMFTTLAPGDLIATGTPPGAGGRFEPPKWLKPGDIVEVESPEIGLLRNHVKDERV